MAVIWKDPLTPKIHIPPVDELKKTWWQLGSAKYQLLPAQYETLVAKEEVVIYMGGYGCSKTRAGTLKVAHWAMIPNNRILVGRNAATDLLETTQRDIVDFLWEAQLLKQAPNTQTKKAVVHCVDPKTNAALGYTSEVFFQHLDDPKHLRGRHLGNYWIDELSECKRDAHLNLQGRLRLPVQAGRYQCLLTGNPEGENWGYDLGWNEDLITKLLCQNKKHAHETFEDSNKCVRLKRRAIHARSIDNWFLPESTLETQMASYSAIEIRRYLEGEFLIFDGAVFPEFDRSIHVLGAA